MPDVLITEAITGPAVEALGRAFDVAVEPDLWQDPAALGERLRDSRAVIVRNQTQLTADALAGCGRLEVIGRLGSGLDNVDLDAAGDAGVVVTYAPNQNSISVAELTLGLMLALAREIPCADKSTHAGGWERQRFTGVELFGKTLGIVGLGRIGFLVGTRARAFGMDVVAYDPAVDPDAFTVAELRAQLLDLPELLARADFVTCHAPETPQTKGLFNAETFGRMKPSAFFVNASRGGLVDEAALARALQNGQLAGAALDVRTQEPPGRSPLCTMENVILTPHVAAFTQEGQTRVVEAVCRDVAAVLKGERPHNAVKSPAMASR